MSNEPNMKAEAPILATEPVSMSNSPNRKAEAPIPMESVSMSNEPDMKAEAPILATESVSMSNEPHLSGGTVTNSRKSAKRTLPWDLNVGELLVSQDEDNPARKKPRLEEPLPTTTDEAARKTASPDISVGLPPPAMDNDDVDANVDPVTDTQPNDGITRATGSWTLEEAAELTRAVTNTGKKRWGKEYKTNWDAVVALVPGRTQTQCRRRWHDVLDPNIVWESGSKIKWTAVEDVKLKDAVQTHGGKDWAAISELVPGRTRSQCWSRWHNSLDPSIGRASGRKVRWTSEEDGTMKAAVQTHGGKNWAAIAALVPGRTHKQCCNRWQFLRCSSKRE
jgi:hypothetical protein